MFSVLLFGLLACASAAPRYGLSERRYGSLSDYMSDDDSYFDTNRFWTGLDTTSLLDSILEDFYKQFPSIVNTEGVQGDKYKILISLPGYETKDIIVKAKVGMLIIEATRTVEGQGLQNYLNIRTLPPGIGVDGSWHYDDDVLTIEFPVKDSMPTTESSEVVTEEITTEAPKDREEMEPFDKASDNDADIGLDSNRGDNDYELKTNQILKQSPVEATTYAVDINNDIELVTVSMK